MERAAGCLEGFVPRQLIAASRCSLDESAHSAFERKVFHGHDERFQVFLGEVRPRGHRRSGQSLSDRSEYVVVGGKAALGRGESKVPQRKVPRLWVKEDRLRTIAEPALPVATRAVLFVERQPALEVSRSRCLAGLLGGLTPPQRQCGHEDQEAR
jgi:hypothetical protein